jgi:hypothetical protein
VRGVLPWFHEEGKEEEEEGEDGRTRATPESRGKISIGHLMKVVLLAWRGLVVPVCVCVCICM